MLIHNLCKYPLGLFVEFPKLFQSRQYERMVKLTRGETRLDGRIRRRDADREGGG